MDYDNFFDLDDQPTPPNISPSEGLSLGFNPLGLLGSAATQGLQNMMNWHWQKKASDYNFDLSQKAAEDQYNRQLQFWNIQNEYNHPGRQTERRLSAGLSPTENIDSGNASGLSSVPGNNFALNGAMNQVYDGDLMQDLQMLAQIDNLGKQGGKITQETANLVQDLYLKSLESELRKANLDHVAEQIKGLRRENAREQKRDENVYTEEYWKNLGQAEQQSALIAMMLLGNQFNISQKDWEFYKKHGIKPDGLSAKDKLLFEYLDNPGTRQMLMDPSSVVGFAGRELLDIVTDIVRNVINVGRGSLKINFD